MIEELKTIKELADEWGISKQAVLKRIQKLPSNKKPQKVNGKYLISLEIKKEMESEINRDTTNNRDTTDNRDTTNKILEMVVKDKKELYSIIHELELRLKESQNLLDQQQRLALQDKKLLEEYKAEINDLKALKMPSEDTKEEQSNYRSLEKEKDFVQTIQESYESEIKVLNQKLAEQEEQIQEIQKEKETKEKKWFQFWK